MAHQSDNVLKLIWNNSTDAIFALDQHGAVIEANPAFQDMLGWSSKELKDEMFPPFIVNMTQDEHQILLSQLRNGQGFPYEIVKRRDKDGVMLDILASYWPVNNGKILALGMYKDITEQMLIQKKLEESEYCYRTLVQYLPEAIIKQCNNKIDFVNTSGLKFLGVSKLEDCINYSIWDFVSSESKEELQRIIDSAYESNTFTNQQTLVATFERKDGKKIWAEVKVIPIGKKTKPDIQIVFRDVTEKKRYETQLEYLAYHDPLTGLKNRRIFTEIVMETIEAAARNQGKLAIMYIDLDKFKSINDTYGHDIGDELLKQFAGKLNDSVNEEDVLCRVGGDEFLVLLKDVNEVEKIVRIAENILFANQQPYRINDLMLTVTSSIGIAVYPKNGKNGKELIYKADQALYQAKRTKNTFRISGDNKKFNKRWLRQA